MLRFLGKLIYYLSPFRGIYRKLDNIKKEIFTRMGQDTNNLVEEIKAEAAKTHALVGEIKTEVSNEAAQAQATLSRQSEQIDALQKAIEDLENEEGVDVEALKDALGNIKDGNSELADTVANIKNIIPDEVEQPGEPVDPNNSGSGEPESSGEAAPSPEVPEQPASPVDPGVEG